MPPTATPISVAEDITSSTYALWLGIGLLFIISVRWLLGYIDLDALDALGTEIKELVATQNKKIPLPSFSQLEEACDRLKARISTLKQACYTIDEASWKEYIGFLIWTRWKEPLGIRWKAGKLRRRILAEAEIENNALERALETHHALRRQNRPLQAENIPGI